MHRQTALWSWVDMTNKKGKWQKSKHEDDNYEEQATHVEKNSKNSIIENKQQITLAKKKIVN